MIIQSQLPIVSVGVRVTACAWQLQILITAAPHDEYDDALRRAPYLCRPFAAAGGDVRSAAECVDGCAEFGGSNLFLLRHSYCRHFFYIFC